jgi:hypothetical protein
MTIAENMATLISICAPIAMAAHLGLLALALWSRAARAV